ncbi:MAG TPA: class I SAM-dependent RNA methyltransferase [Candidatus Dormibacteraeota bacterium]|nr:class I SAM-dependent RNA methyltransferase [Candidatus Dormibacteraeota bacterium]
MSASEAEARPAPPPRAKGDRLTLRLGDMVHGGACIARSDEGEVIFVDGAIPGELAVVELRFRRKKLWYGRVVSLLEASPHRVAPPCPYVPDCGGCQLQHVDYSHQLHLKRDIVLDAMRRQQVTLPEVRVHRMADPWRYRRRGEFHVVPGAGGVRDAGLGFNRPRSWSSIAVEDCLIHHDSIARSLPALRQAVRESGDEKLTVVHLTAGDDGRELLVRGKPRRALSVAAVDDAARTLPPDLHWNTESTTLHWRGHMFRVMPESFIQVNQEQMDVLYTLALSALGDVTGQRIVDGYAGIGVLSTALAETAGEVVCIEENPVAVHMGRLNARMNGVDDVVRYVCAPVETALAQVAGEGAVDAVVLDPPRAGCEGGVTGWLALAGPPRVVYVSCDPATLARDLHVLATSGPYTVERFDLVDMFPQTHHVESVVSLRRST